MPTLARDTGSRTLFGWAQCNCLSVWNREDDGGKDFHCPFQPGQYPFPSCCVWLHLAMCSFSVYCSPSMSKQAVCVFPSWLQFLLLLSWQEPETGLLFTKVFPDGRSPICRGCFVMFPLIVWFCVCAPGVTSSKLHVYTCGIVLPFPYL